MELIPPAPDTLSRSYPNTLTVNSTALTLRSKHSSTSSYHKALDNRTLHRVSSHAQSTDPNRKITTSTQIIPSLSTMFMPIRITDRASAHEHVLSTHHVEYLPSDKRESNKRRSRGQHKGIPPAVAALLAVTAIPVTSKKAQRFGRSRRTALDIYVERTPSESSPSPDNLFIVDENTDDSALIFGSLIDNEPVSFSRCSSSAALSVLLSPPDEFDDKDSCSLSVRSSSSESVPSLDDDAASLLSWSGPSTPTSRERRSRVVSPPPEDCALDHPLLFTKEQVADLAVAQSENLNESIVPGFRPLLSFKSNLTASLRALKSAAKSFSSFAPLTQPDDLLTRSIFSNTPRYADEKRPRPSKEVPTPAMRRYLNPGSSVGKENHCTGAIQMQTYNRVRRAPRQKTRPVQIPRTDEGDTPRPREPRENSDFLRVIVLEMNMRRGGKLSDTAQGKARLVLPPRQVPKTPRAVGDLPRRWEILSAQ